MWYKYKNHPSVLIAVHHEIFTASALEALVRRTSAFRVPDGKTELGTADYINTQG